MQKTLGITAIQSNNIRKINLYCKYYENKSQALTKTVITYDYNAVQTQNLPSRVCPELRNGILRKLFLLRPFFITSKDKSMKKN